MISSDALGPSFARFPRPRSLERVRLDNAALLAHRIYDTDLDLFDRVWVREHGDLRRTIPRIIDLAKSPARDDPFGAIRSWVAPVVITTPKNDSVLSKNNK